MPNLVLEARDIDGRLLRDVRYEISSDGTTWHKAPSHRLPLKDGEVLHIRAIKAIYWEVTQAIERNGDKVAKYTSNKYTVLIRASKGASNEYVLVFWMTCLRDARAFLAKEHQWNPIAEKLHTLHVFGGDPVLNPDAGVGWDRMVGRLQADVPSHDGGELIIMHAPPSSRVSRIVAVFVPAGMVPFLAKPVPIHVFLKPSTGATGYPYSTNIRHLFFKYLVGSSYRLLNQHIASKRACLFVLPMIAQEANHGELMQAPKLRRYLREVVDCLQRLQASPALPPRLGDCAVSGQSRGGAAVLGVMRTAIPAQGPSTELTFPELKELYSFDGNEADVRAMRPFMKRWLANGRRLRMYATDKYPGLRSFRPDFPKSREIANHDAWEWLSHDKNATYLWNPISFWQRLRVEQNNTVPNPDYFPAGNIALNEHSVHLLPLMTMVTHALALSRFRRL